VGVLLWFSRFRNPFGYVRIPTSEKDTLSEGDGHGGPGRHRGGREWVHNPT
jgi:hypothetical protein